MSDKESILPTMNNPLSSSSRDAAPQSSSTSRYDEALAMAERLAEKPKNAAGKANIARQHQKNRMTVWERLEVLADAEPHLLYQNWGPNLDGASLVTAVIQIEGRDVAVYGHDFTLRAGSMDATNGQKLASLFDLAGDRGIPVIGMNDSAGAYVPAGVGGLDGYAKAFAALRNISGVVPSIMCMFGFNAGGGSYLPRQGSFVIQPNDTFFGLTGAGVVKSVLGEDVTPEALGGPSVHAQTGVADYIVQDELAALRLARSIMQYIPDNHSSQPLFQSTSDPITRETLDVDTLLRKAIDSPTGYNTPIDVTLIIQQVCDYGDYFEFQPNRARNSICAFGRLGGYVVGFCANNSAVASGQIDIDAAYKNTRFIRFCNLYNIPMIFMEDTTGFLPGQDQESRGIVQAGRAMLDAIIDLRTPRFLLIIRNAFGGAYASFNNYHTGADVVFALPTTRVAVMGPAGKAFVYKKELRELQASYAKQVDNLANQAAQKSYTSQNKSHKDESHKKKQQLDAWLKAEEAALDARYEQEIMNPKEALSLGSISQLIMPKSLRTVLGEQMAFYMRHYSPSPYQAVQREFY